MRVRRHSPPRSGYYHAGPKTRRRRGSFALQSGPWNSARAACPALHAEAGRLHRAVPRDGAPAAPLPVYTILDVGVMHRTIAQVTLALALGSAAVGTYIL